MSSSKVAQTLWPLDQLGANGYPQDNGGANLLHGRDESDSEPGGISRFQFAVGTLLGLQ